MAQSQDSINKTIDTLDASEIVYTLSGNKAELARVKNEKGLIFLEIGNFGKGHPIGEGASLRLLKESADLYQTIGDSLHYYSVLRSVAHFYSTLYKFDHYTIAQLESVSTYFKHQKDWSQYIDNQTTLMDYSVGLKMFHKSIEYGKQCEMLIKNELNKATFEDTLLRARLYSHLTFLYLKLYQQHTPDPSYIKKAQYYTHQCQNNFTPVSSYSWVHRLNNYALGLTEEFSGNYEKALAYYKLYEPTVPQTEKYSIYQLYSHFQFCYYKLKQYDLAQKFTVKNNELMESVYLDNVHYAMDYGISGHDLTEQDVEILLNKQRAEDARIVAEKRTRWLWIILISLSSLVAYLLQRQAFKNKKNKLALATTLANLQKENTTKILELQEQERQYIAQELHDSLGGMLAIAKLNAENVQAIPSAENMNNLVSLLNESQNELRQIIDQFQTPTFGQINLTDMMSDWISKLRQWNPKIDFQFQHSGQESGTDLMRQQLFRVAQELVHNAIKHANASVINLELNFFEDNAILLIQDNGIGIDTTQSNSGQGLENIHSRLKLLKGYIEFFANIPSGTCVLVHIPTNI